jgi:hypothetical protein
VFFALAPCVVITVDTIQPFNTERGAAEPANKNTLRSPRAYVREHGLSSPPSLFAFGYVMKPHTNHQPKFVVKNILSQQRNVLSLRHTHFRPSARGKKQQ